MQEPSLLWRRWEDWTALLLKIAILESKAGKDYSWMQQNSREQYSCCLTSVVKSFDMKISLERSRKEMKESTGKEK